MILDTVVEFLKAEGYDGFYVRDVAQRAHVSLKTLYKLFPTRDALVIAALGRWHRDHGFAAVAVAPPAGVSVQDGLRMLLRQTFEPWERDPNILKAYVRALSVPAGAELHAQLAASMEPIRFTVYADLDPAYAEDVKAILADVAYAAGARFAAGVIDITELRLYLERVVGRLAEANTAQLPPREPLPAT